MRETRTYKVAERRRRGGYRVTTHPHPARQTYPRQVYGTARAAIASIENRTRLIQHQTRRTQVAKIELLPWTPDAILECRETGRLAA